MVNLPYGALISPTDGKYFIEKYRAVVAPSANVFVTCTELARAKARPGPERLLSVGNPHFAHRQFPELQALPAANMEAEAVAASYGAVPLLGAQAQEREVRAAMSSAEVIHLASHYVINEQSPMLSSLLLAEEPRQAAGQHDADGQLQAFEVYGMKLPRTRLVVLSACQTGVERSYQGEGAIGFARAFISAGAPLVVARFWPVDSDATTELMIKFHQNRKLARLSSAEALRQAQLDMLKDRDAAKRRPYAWASFVVIGGFADF